MVILVHQHGVQLMVGGIAQLWHVQQMLLVVLHVLVTLVLVEILCLIEL
jgi:hypothetical protein